MATHHSQSRNTSKLDSANSHAGLKEIDLWAPEETQFGRQPDGESWDPERHV